MKEPKEKTIRLYREALPLEKRRKLYGVIPPNKDTNKSDKWIVYSHAENGVCLWEPSVCVSLSDEEFHSSFEVVKGFDKNYRGKFGYWFAHWCAYNLTAITLHCWKPKYLLHDIEKPFLLCLARDYKKVQKWHRQHNKHHTEYAFTNKETMPDFGKIDWEAAVIDWECSKLTKTQAQMNARETLEWLVSHGIWKSYEKTIREHCEPVLDRLGL